MKKIFIFLALAAVAAIAFSCAKEEKMEKSGNNSQQVSSEAYIGHGEALMSFGVTTPDVIDSRLSVDLSTGVTGLQNNDEVLVFVNGDNYAIYKYDGEKFALKDGEQPVALSSAASVFYPANEFIVTNNRAIFEMPFPIETSAGLGAINPMAGEISGTEGNYSVELHNFVSVLRVKVTADENVEKVSLDFGGKRYGTFSEYDKAEFDVDASNCEMVYAGGGEYSVEIWLDNPAKSADVLFLIPTLELEDGLKVTAQLEANHNGGSKTFTVTNASTAARARNTVSTMNFYAGLFSGGAGTAADPYKISTARDFKNISKYTTEGYGSIAASAFLGAYYKQTADIDLKNATLTPIGIYNATSADAKPFTGVYDGDGKTLSKFIVTGTQANSTGLFEYVDGATLKNIAIGTCSVTGPNTTGILTGRCIGTTTIENCSLTGPANVQGRNSVGFIAHLNSSSAGSPTVKNCTVSNITVITADSGADANNQGGVVGFAGGASTIDSCSTSGAIQFTGTASGAARGGIVGKFDSTGQVKDCSNNGVVTNALVGSTGGIAGQLTNGTIVDCANTANVSGTSMVGGIVGFAGSTTTDGSATNITFITSCRNAANVTGSANCVSGIAGKLQNGVVMSACYAQGDVKTSTYDVGGLAGLIQINNNNAASRIYVYDCIANMNVTTTRASGACRTGGAVGNITTTGQYVAVDNCGVLDVTITAGGEYVGGFAGWMTGDASNSNRARIRNCYTLVSSVPGSAKKGGFIGAVSNKAELRYDYFVADDSSDISTATTASYSKKTASEIKSDATCTTFNGNNNFSLTVGSTVYSSARGWALTNGYPVPGALITLGADYHL